MGFRDEWARWMFDEAVYVLGRYVDNKRAETTGKGKDRRPRWTLDEILTGRAEAKSKELNSEAAIQALMSLSF